jgi:hypothetical protein
VDKNENSKIWEGRNGSDINWLFIYQLRFKEKLCVQKSVKLIDEE